MTDAILGETALDLTPVIEAMPETTLGEVMFQIAEASLELGEGDED